MRGLQELIEVLEFNSRHDAKGRFASGGGGGVGAGGGGSGKGYERSLKEMSKTPVALKNLLLTKKQPRDIAHASVARGGADVAFREVNGRSARIYYREKGGKSSLSLQTRVGDNWHKPTTPASFSDAMISARQFLKAK